MRTPARRGASVLEVLAISARMQISHMRSSGLTIVFAVFQPGVLLLVALLPAQGRTPEQAARVAFGVILTAFWTATVWSAASVLRRDRAMGTLARSLTGVKDARLVVLGRGLGSSLLSVALVSLVVTVVLLVLGQPVALAHPVWLALGALVVLASGAAVGLLIGSIFVVTRFGPQVSSALMYPGFLLGGMLIPPDVLPPWISWVSFGISLRWLQQFFVSTSTDEVQLRALVFASGLTVLYGVLGSLSFQRMIRRARLEGTIDLS